MHTYSFTCSLSQARLESHSSGYFRQRNLLPSAEVLSTQQFWCHVWCCNKLRVSSYYHCWAQPGQCWVPDTAGGEYVIQKTFHSHDMFYC